MQSVTKGRTMQKLIVILLCLPIFCHGRAPDQTLQPLKTRGETVVDATIEKIRSQGILVDEKQLMTRIAAVRTDSGRNSAPNTGGIWRVNDVILEAVKNSCEYKMHKVCDQILQRFSFDMTKATIPDMDVPLYSALVMNTYISITDGKAVPDAQSNQAGFLKKLIQSKGNKNNFTGKSNINSNNDDFPNPCTEANIRNNKMRFKHAKSSNEYIQCKPTGQMEIVKCPKGTQYDESQLACDTQIVDIPQDGTLYQGVNPCSAEAIKMRQFYFYDTSDESKFIQCDEKGTAFSLNCPQYTVWSQKATACLLSSDTIVYNTPIATCIPPRDGLHKGVNPCTIEALRRGQFFFANPSDESKFIQCDEKGTAFSQKCPQYTVWSQKAMTCILSSDPSPYNTPKTAAIILYDGLHKGKNPCTIEVIRKGQFFFANPSDKSKFIQCDEKGTAFSQNCPQYTEWSQKVMACIRGFNTIADNTPKTTCIPPHDRVHKGVNPCTTEAIKRGHFYFANPSDRSTFIQCDEKGTAFLMDCAKNTLWSPRLNACAHSFGYSFFI